MGKHVSPIISLVVPSEILERLKVAISITNSKNRSELLIYILTSWLDNNGF